MNRLSKNKNLSENHRKSSCGQRHFERKPGFRTGSKNGFTLMEILVAMSLMGFLAVVTWTLFDTYRNLFESGIDRSGRIRLARALSEQLSDDLRSAIQESNVRQTVSLQTTETSDESWSVESSQNNNQTDRSSSSQTTDSTNAIDTSSADPADQQATTTTSDQSDSQDDSTDMITTRRFGLFGSRHTLRLDILQVDPHYVYRLASRTSATTDESVGSLLFDDTIGEEAVSAVGQKAELRTIEYTFTPKEEEGINAQTREEDPLAETPIATQAESTESTAIEPPRRPGLMRRELSFDILLDGTTDPFLETIGPENLDSETSLDPNECYLPEVSDLSFRYYDGSGWTTSWDSLARRSLPVAVEITFKIETDHQKKKRLGEQMQDTTEEQDTEVSEDATVGADVETDEIAYIDETYEDYQDDMNPPPENEYRVLVTIPTSAKYPGVKAELDDPQFETTPEPIAPGSLRQPTLKTPSLKSQENSKPDERWMRSQE